MPLNLLLGDSHRHHPPFSLSHSRHSHFVLSSGTVIRYSHSVLNRQSSLLLARDCCPLLWFDWFCLCLPPWLGCSLVAKGLAMLSKQMIRVATSAIRQVCVCLPACMSQKGAGEGEREGERRGREERRARRMSAGGTCRFPPSVQARGWGGRRVHRGTRYPLRRPPATLLPLPRRRERGLQQC